MEEKIEKLNLSGDEIVSLAGAIAVCLSKKYDSQDLFSLRLLFQAVVSNISIIEFKSKK